MGVSVLGCLLNGFIIIQATHGQIQVLDGLYISGKEIVNICTANIKMGVKLREADRACPVKHAEHRLDTKVYKGVDYKDEPEEVDCPTGMEILAEASKTKAGDVCVLRKIGWVDMNLSPIEKTIESDIVSLPIHVLQAVTGRDYWSCIDRRVVVKNCPYTDEERSSVIAALTGVARLECYKMYFEAACREYTAATIANLTNY